MASVVEELELEQMSIRHKEPAEYASFEDYRQPRDERMRWRPPNPTRAFAAANLTPPPFRHDTLSRFNAAIRLLQVLPGKNDHALECRLRTFELDSVPPFVALSYRWGTKPTPHNLIHIDGLPYKVWDNLHSFLCYFRNDAFNKPGTYIWIGK